MVQKRIACDRRSAHLRQIVGLLLAIDQVDAVAQTKPAQRHQQGFRAIAHLGEHGFAVEHAADAHAVQTGAQRIALPQLETVGQAARVQGGVGLKHVGGDPGAGVGALRAALLHHAGEGGVDPKMPIGAATEPTCRFFQRARHMQLLGPQHHARIGAPPQQRLARAEPGENTLPVGPLQGVGIELPAHGKQAGERRQCGERLRCGRKVIARFKPGDLPVHGLIFLE